jgi:hypothetical protein
MAVMGLDDAGVSLSAPVVSASVSAPVVPGTLLVSQHGDGIAATATASSSGVTRPHDPLSAVVRATNAGAPIRLPRTDDIRIITHSHARPVLTPPSLVFDEASGEFGTATEMPSTGMLTDRTNGIDLDQGWLMLPPRPIVRPTVARPG